MSLQKIIYAIYFLFSFSVLSAQDNSNSVFDAHRGGKVASLQTVDDWHQYCTRLKDKLFEGIASFEKTPLNFIITGTIKRETFEVEKIYLVNLTVKQIFTTNTFSI